MTAQESPRPSRPTRIPQWRQPFDHAGVTAEVRDWGYHGSGTEDDPFAVEWIDDDPRNPMLYSTATKWTITGLVAIESLGASFCSSAYTGGAEQIIAEFKCSREVFTLGLSLFVLGFGLGPLLWGPLSEMYGRQYVFTGCFFGLTAFNAGAAGSQNIWTLIILRFFAGSIGSSALTNSGAVIADMFAARNRGLATAVYAMTPWLGPVLGPIVGGFVGETIGWRWLEGILAIFSGTVWIAGSLLVPETYAPVILRRRAQELSKVTGMVYKSRGDIEQSKNGAHATTAKNLVRRQLLRPWTLLIHEPIVLLFSVYQAIVYGTLYMCFAAFPIVYQENRGWSPGVGGLPFLGVMVGMIFAIMPLALIFNKYYQRVSDKNGGHAPPETRLPGCMIGAVAAPIGLFWFAWTNSPSIHWLASVVAGGVFGLGLVLIFNSGTNYLIDSYTIYAASVLAANSILRSVFGAVFPLFTTYMYASLGIHWASSVPAFLALLCLPCPFLFYKYGPIIRQRCKYAAESAAFLKQIQSTRKGAQPAEEQTSEAKEEEAEKGGEAV